LPSGEEEIWGGVPYGSHDAKELMVFSVPDNQVIYSQDYFSSMSGISAAKGVQFFDNDNKLFVYHVGDDADDEYYYSIFEIDYGSAPQLPLPPTNLDVVTISDTELRIDWIESVSLGVTGYKIYQNTICGGSPFVQVGTADFFSHSGLSPDTTYYYSMKAIGSGGDSVCSGFASGTTDSAMGGYSIDPPTNLVASEGGTNIVLTWDAPPMPSGFKFRVLSGNHFYYRVYRNSVDDPSTATDVGLLRRGITTYTDVNVAPGTTYYYWVKAYSSLFRLIDPFLSSDFSVGDSGSTQGVGANCDIPGSVDHGSYCTLELILSVGDENGDGYTSISSGSSWSEVRDAAIGTNVGSNYDYIRVSSTYIYGSFIGIRGHLPFRVDYDLLGRVTGAKLKLTTTSARTNDVADGHDKLYLFESDQLAVNNLVDADYGGYSLSSSDRLGEPVSFSSIPFSSGAVVEFDLNSQGINLVEGAFSGDGIIRLAVVEGHHADGATFPGTSPAENDISFWSSEVGGGDVPVLEVYYV